MSSRRGRSFSIATTRRCSVPRRACGRALDAERDRGLHNDRHEPNVAEGGVVYRGVLVTNVSPAANERLIMTGSGRSADRARALAASGCADRGLPGPASRTGTAAVHGWASRPSPWVAVPSRKVAVLEARVTAPVPAAGALRAGVAATRSSLLSRQSSRATVRSSSLIEQAGTRTDPISATAAASIRAQPAPSAPTSRGLPSRTYVDVSAG